MSNNLFLQLFLAALGGGLTTKFLDILYGEYRRGKDKAERRNKFVEKSFDPLLKSADELVGKLRSLAEKDFKPIKRLDGSEELFGDSDLSSLVYLFLQFWARIEKIRIDGMTVEMAQTERGRQLQKFINCLESRKVRIINRITQRAAAECLLKEGQPMLFIHFARAYENDEEVKRWIEPLTHFLERVNETTQRQKLLQYYTVLHAFVDTLDPKHRQIYT